MKLLGLFIILNIANVIIQTVKSIATIKCGKTIASIVNAIAYGLYTVVIVYTNCELPLYQKVMVVALSNLVGVYVVKFLEEKMRKDRLWKIEFTCKGGGEKTYALAKALREKGISTSYIELNNGYTQLTSWCKTQGETKIVSQFIKDNNCKYFITESKYSL